MLKNKAVVIMVALVLALAVVAISCAPAAKPATSTPPATTTPSATPPATPPKVTTPSATPPAPPAAAAPAGSAASWGESKTYTDDKYGLSFSYPAKWVILDPVGIMIYDVAASTESGVENASLSVREKTDDVAEAVRVAYETNPNLSSMDVKVDIVSSKATILADGKTAANEVVLSAKILGVYDLYGYNVAVIKGDNLVWCSALTLGGSKKQALCREIVSTFAVK